jgi:hypothetical protein
VMILRSKIPGRSQSAGPLENSPIHRGGGKVSVGGKSRVRQPVLAAQTGFEKYGRKSKRERFLTEMELVVPWVKGAGRTARFGGKRMDGLRWA